MKIVRLIEIVLLAKMLISPAKVLTMEETHPTEPTILSLHISLKKQVLLMLEPIWIEAKLTNSSPSTISVVPLDPSVGYIRFIIQNSKGEEMKHIGPRASVPAPTFVEVSPNSSISAIYDLLPHYEIPHKPVSYITRSLNPEKYSLQPDEYTVYARYRPYHDERVMASDTVYLQIQYPAGAQWELFELFLDAKKLSVESCLGGRKSEERAVLKDETLARYQMIVEQYPGSVYAPVAQYEIMSMLMPMTIPAHEHWDPDKALAECKKMIERYPDYPEAKRTIYSLIRCYHEKKAVEEGKDYLRTIIEKYEGTSLSRTARAALDRWDGSEIIFEPQE